MTRRLLSIESATDWLSIALLEEGEVVLCLEAPGERQHAAALLPLVDSGLGQAGWRMDDLDGLVVSTGPGSFTSLRIGLATAKGLAFGREWSAVGVSTLEAMAARALDGGEGREEALVLLDARRGEWYAGSWARTDGGSIALPLEARLREGLYSIDGVARDLDRPVVVASPERAGWRRAFEASGLDAQLWVEGESAKPRADWVGRLGQAYWAAGRGQPVEALEARYLRRAEAEAKRVGEPVEAGELSRLGTPRD